MEVILIRHGKTAGNIKRRYVGITDEPLCEEGIIHAQQSGFDNNLKHLYVSPMKRALETAKIKFPNAAMTICADLREMDFGDFEGRSALDMEQDDEYRRWVDSNCTLRCPNGESLDEFSKRICLAFDTIVRESIEVGESRIVIVAHGGSIMSILSKYALPQRLYHEWYVDNCSGYHALLNDADWSSAPALTECARFETFGE